MMENNFSLNQLATILQKLIRLIPKYNTTIMHVIVISSILESRFIRKKCEVLNIFAQKFN